MDRSFKLCLSWIATYTLIVHLAAIPHHSCVDAHGMDDFFFLNDDEITSEPSVSSQPSPVPSNYPSLLPSSIPSSSPSYSMQEFVFYVDITFDEFRGQELDSEAEDVFETAMTRLVSKALIVQNDNFSVRTVFKNYFLDIYDVVQRRLSTPRKVQQEDFELRILVDLFVDVRSAVTYSTEKVKEIIRSSLDELKEREDFIVELQRKDDVFSPINTITRVKINDEEIHFLSASQESNGIITLTAAIITIPVLCLSLFVYLFHHRRRKKWFNRGERPTPFETPTNLSFATTNLNQISFIIIFSSSDLQDDNSSEFHDETLSEISSQSYVSVRSGFQMPQIEMVPRYNESDLFVDDVNGNSDNHSTLIYV